MESASDSHRVPEEPHGVAGPAVHHVVNYVMIFYTLVALTVLTVLIAAHRFENELANVLLALLVASIKATFVAAYFMHLKFEGKLIYLILIVPLVLTVLLVLSLIPDVGHGIHKVFYIPPLVTHDALPRTHY